MAERLNAEKIEKLVKIRDWIDENFPKHYSEYETKFIEKAKEVGLDPHTLQALKREFELRFNLSHTEWNMLYLLLSFSAMRQGGIKGRFVDEGIYKKELKVDVYSFDEREQHLMDKMILLMWDMLEGHK